MTAPWRFAETWYEPWCHIWLLLQNHRQRLADWLGQQPYPALAEVEISRAALGGQLARLSPAHDPGAVDTATLARALACLRALEREHPKDARVFPPIKRQVRVAGCRYVLIPPLRRGARPDSAGFSLSKDLAIDGVLGLDFAWVRVQDRDDLDWRLVPELEPLRGVTPVRLGLAPVASSQDMSWQLDPGDVRGMDRRVPIRCNGASDGAGLWRRVEAVLSQAWEARVHILVFPELVMDQALLQHCQDWLAQRNLRENRLHLVVAGSRHCQEGDAFANRCSVLGHMGDVVWEQDKRSPFVINDAGTLQTLSTAPIAKAFEPTALGPTLVLAETLIGRLLTPICLDFIEGDLWPELGADFYLVPAMTPNLARFDDQAKAMGGRHGAATLICNAQTSGEQRQRVYLPYKGAPQAEQQGMSDLFTVDVPITV